MRKELLTAHTPFFKGKDGETTLPILYYNDRTTLSFFTADYKAVKEMLPSDKMEPIRLSKNRCVATIAVFNYLHSAVGSYGEFIICIPLLYNRKPMGPLPLLLQSIDPAFGLFIAHCPVTSHAALEAGF
ncbi:MAG: acetoacetate decarboxylase family protein [Synergistaceae bacterium]